MSQSKINELTLVQLNLLNGVLPLLKPGGRLVYSTCTINPEENSFLIERFLESHPELILVSQRQVYPSIQHSGDGFYGAVLEFI